MFDFDYPLERRGSGSMKWDETPEGVIPLWVADMDFRTAPCIIEALRNRVEHGAFGYTFVDNNYYNALTSWFLQRHGWNIEPSSVIYTSGVVPAISAIIKGLLKPNDGIIVQTPAYNCFYSSIRNNGCKLINAPLIYHHSGYTIDFDALDTLSKSDNVKMLLLCNPHNPVGRVWTHEELQHIGDICLKNNVFVLSDEIHCELTFNNHYYTPYQTLGKDYAMNSVACVSPSKAFNTAGLQIANIVCPDPDIYRKVNRGINDNEVCDVNPFGVAGLIAAYTQGGEWLDELKQYLWKNYCTVKDFFDKNLPHYPIVPLEGTYLLWIDCSHAHIESENLSKRLIEEAHVWLSPGSMYGLGGEQFLRMNIACPRQRLMEALERIKEFFITL